MTGLAGSDRVVGRARDLAAVTPGHALLMARMLGWACALAVLKWTIPLDALVRLAWRRPHDRIRQTTSELVVTLARRACRVIRWPGAGNCLERALVTYRFLLMTGARPTLHTGLRRDTTGRWRGHAWVEIDGRAIDERSDTSSAFSALLTFGPDGNVLQSAPLPRGPGPQARAGVASGMRRRSAHLALRQALGEKGYGRTRQSGPALVSSPGDTTIDRSGEAMLRRVDAEDDRVVGDAADDLVD